MSALRFYNAIPEVDDKTPKELVPFFVYFLTNEQGESFAATKAIAQCFKDCDLKPPTSLANYLSRGVNGSLYVKVDGGYRLERKKADELSSLLGTRRAVIQTSGALRSLEASIADPQTKAFLVETVDCFEAGANRAAVIMAWVLAFDHFLNWVFANKLTEFNRSYAASNAKNPPSPISSIEDFEAINEDRIITICRSAGIITNGVRDILTTGLRTRNTAAHPSDVMVAQSKTISVIEDLVTNVLKKY